MQSRTVTGQGIQGATLQRHYLMKCQWCNCDVEGSGHANVAECNEALKREVESLRKQLTALEPKLKATRPTSDKPKRPWKPTP